MTDRVDRVLASDVVAVQDGRQHGDGGLAGGEVLGVARVRGADGGGGAARVGLGVVAVCVGDRVQGVRSRFSDRGGREGRGELAYTEHGEGQPLEPDLVGHCGGFGDHTLMGQAGARHRLPIALCG
jgi:hypothetical protein